LLRFLLLNAHVYSIVEKRELWLIFLDAVRNQENDEQQRQKDIVGIQNRRCVAGLAVVPKLDVAYVAVRRSDP
jgi:hypothetical protein